MFKHLSYDKSFGYCARYWRKAAGLNLRDAAAKVGIGFTYLSKIENDLNGPPSVEVLEGLAVAYGVKRLEVFVRGKRLPPEWEAQLFEPVAFYETAKLLEGLNRPRQVKPLTEYDHA